mmetsp:Transcript_110570/g.219870  ORF Transcript_110570/g.219870 Transcript_110570/m.219870 type:complete len:108 (+) Transcript_110570:896-1219(+)
MGFPEKVRGKSLAMSRAHCSKLSPGTGGPTTPTSELVGRKPAKLCLNRSVAWKELLFDSAFQVKANELVAGGSDAGVEQQRSGLAQYRPLQLRSLFRMRSGSFRKRV